MQLHMESIVTAAAALRWLLPVLAGFLFYRLMKSLVFYRGMREIWAWVILADDKRLPVTHWENTLGSAKSCDVHITGKKVSRVHAVLTRADDGTWTITDADSKSGVKVGTRKVKEHTVKYGQSVTLGDVKFTLEGISPEQEKAQADYRRREGSPMWSSVNLLLLTFFQFCLGICLLGGGVESQDLLLPFGVLIGVQWLLFIFYKLIRRRGYEVETVAFFLSTLGQAVIASSNPDELFKQTVCLILGIGFFLFLGWLLRDTKRALVARIVAAILGLGLLLFTLLFGTEVNGAKNWIFIAGMSLQPSELAKVCFVFVGASSLNTLVTKKNLLLFIAYTGAVCLMLAVLSDFGTALVFFVAFLVIAFLRSGNFAALGLISAGTGFAGLLAVRFLPYIKNRFASWRHVWEHALTGGYQQTRAMMCIASGGLLGLGAAQGWLKYVAASDTDLVFAFVAEELGLIMAILMVLYVALLALFAVRSANLCRSSFYSIGAVAAVSILLTQTILNVFGTVDLLPLTGVTFPFVSNGGTSMIAAWGLLAFLKAADTRQNASFAIPLAGRAEK